MVGGDTGLELHELPNSDEKKAKKSKLGKNGNMYPSVPNVSSLSGSKSSLKSHDLENDEEPKETTPLNSQPEKY